jgi:hypothetical protein
VEETEDGNLILIIAGYSLGTKTFACGSEVAFHPAEQRSENVITLTRTMHESMRAGCTMYFLY